MNRRKPVPLLIRWAFQHFLSIQANALMFYCLFLLLVFIACPPKMIYLFSPRLVSSFGFLHLLVEFWGVPLVWLFLPHPWLEPQPSVWPPPPPQPEKERFNQLSNKCLPKTGAFRFSDAKQLNLRVKTLFSCSAFLRSKEASLAQDIYSLQWVGGWKGANWGETGDSCCCCWNKAPHSLDITA